MQLIIIFKKNGHRLSQYSSVCPVFSYPATVGGRQDPQLQICGRLPRPVPLLHGSQDGASAGQVGTRLRGYFFKLNFEEHIIIIIMIRLKRKREIESFWNMVISQSRLNSQYSMKWAFFVSFFFFCLMSNIHELISSRLKISILRFYIYFQFHNSRIHQIQFKKMRR